jgi:multiple sugar transport system ATP-binding protein
MVAIDFHNVMKAYGKKTIIKHFDASIKDGDFLVLLGPSGCGKSTMLRMIAGLTEITSGELKFDGRVVNELTPKQRGIAFVFQTYALYPQMTIRENIAFPLLMDEWKWWWHLPFVHRAMMRSLSRRKDIAEKVESTAAILELTDYLNQKPKTLSGGQRQRVAVARSIVREPAVYLLDEPLSNLDAQLRTQMRSEISALHTRVQKTFIYVTHDQVEAMTMATKVILMNKGVVQQFGTPEDIYENPSNVFVAGFIGSPPMNIIPVDIVRDGLVTRKDSILHSGATAERLKASGLERAQLGIRAEKVRLSKNIDDDSLSIQAHVALCEHLGAETIVGVRFGKNNNEVSLGEAASKNLFRVRLPETVDWAVGQDCYVTFSDKDVHVFDAESGEKLDIA